MPKPLPFGSQILNQDSKVHVGRLHKLATVTEIECFLEQWVTMTPAHITGLL